MSDGTKLTREQFLEDVKDHRLTIIKDDGLYRHLRFKQPGTSNMFFDIVTWPGYLAYTGDMGSFVFTRIEDMLGFFRSKRGELGINTGYWGRRSSRSRWMETESVNSALKHSAKTS